MNYLIIIALVITAVGIHSALLKHVLSAVDGLKQRISAQDDIISRVATKQFEDSRNTVSVEESVSELAKRVRENEREIYKVKMFAYRQSCMKETDDEAQGI